MIDTNGENPTVQVVTNITQDADGVVFMPVDTRHGFEDGSYVTFSGVKGMTELNGREFKITTPSECSMESSESSSFISIDESGPFTITIGDTSGFGAYEGGGTVTEVKKPETIQFVSDDLRSVVDRTLPRFRNRSVNRWRNLTQPSSIFPRCQCQKICIWHFKRWDNSKPNTTLLRAHGMRYVDGS